MATIIQDVNIRLVLARLRPGAEYGWRGGRGDFGNTLDAVIWRDPDQKMPSQSQIIAEWEVVVAEDQAAGGVRAELMADAPVRVVGVVLGDVLGPDLADLVRLLLYNAGAVDLATGRVKPFEEWVAPLPD